MIKRVRRPPSPSEQQELDKFIHELTDFEAQLNVNNYFFEPFELLGYEIFVGLRKMKTIAGNDVYGRTTEKKRVCVENEYVSNTLAGIAWRDKLALWQEFKKTDAYKCERDSEKDSE
jgi:hypothetical protein